MARIGSGQAQMKRSWDKQNRETARSLGIIVDLFFLPAKIILSIIFPKKKKHRRKRR